MRQKSWYSYNKTNKCTSVKSVLLHTVCDISDMFRSILINFRDWLNDNKANIKIQRIIKYIKICL
jgi:hypothetical protein